MSYLDRRWSKPDLKVGAAEARRTCKGSRPFLGTTCENSLTRKAFEASGEGLTQP